MCLHRQVMCLTNWLVSLKLEQYVAVLNKIGYDDPDDFHNFDKLRLDKFARDLKENGVKQPHIDKMLHSIQSRRSSSASSPLPATPSESASPTVVAVSSLPAADSESLGQQFGSSKRGEAAHWAAAEAESAEQRCWGSLLLGTDGKQVCTPGFKAGKGKPIARGGRGWEGIDQTDAAMRCVPALNSAPQEQVLPQLSKRR